MYYQLALIPKFVGVILFSGGFVAAYLVTDEQHWKRAVHHIASPGLLLTWVFGYAAAYQAGLSLRTPWIGGSLIASFIAQALLVKKAPWWLAALPVLVTIGLMVVKPV